MMEVSESQAQKLVIIRASEIQLEDVPIGRGGYGTVYRGNHNRYGTVAVKTLVEKGLLPEKHTKVLKKEAKKLLEVCQHQSILKLIGLIMEKDNYSLVLEYMALGSLSDFRRDFTVQWPLVVRLVWDIVNGMDYLHSAIPPVLHLDLKADNILINGQLRAKIADFGLSEWRSVTSTVTRQSSENSSRRCTVSHVPPEVWSNVNLPPNKQYDVYSFGILLWELVSGTIPYGNSSDDLVRSAVLSGQRPDFSQIPKECPTELTNMITRTWHQKQMQRPSFKDLRREVDKLFEEKYHKDVIQALRNVRAEIVDEYEPNDQVFKATLELENLPDPIEPDPEPETEPEPVAGTSSSGTSSVARSVSRSSSTREEQEMEEGEESDEESYINVQNYKRDTDYTQEEQQICKILHNPVAMRMAKSRHARDLFRINEKSQKILTKPNLLRRFIDQDRALKWELKLCKFNVEYELSGVHVDTIVSKSKHFIEVNKDRISSSNFGKEEKHDENYYRMRGEDPEKHISEREKRARRVSKAMFKNELFRGSKGGGNMYRLKKALENAGQLSQAIKDKESGGKGSLRLSTIEPEVLELCRDPFLLLPCLYSNDHVLSTLAGSYPELFLKLVSNAKATGSYNRPSSSSQRRQADSYGPQDYDMMEEMMMMAEMERMGPRRRMMRGMYDDMDDDDEMMYMMRMREMMDMMRPRRREDIKRKPSAMHRMMATMGTSRPRKAMSMPAKSESFSSESILAKKAEKAECSIAEKINPSFENPVAPCIPAKSVKAKSTLIGDSDSDSSSDTPMSDDSTDPPKPASPTKDSNTGIFGTLKNMVFGSGKEKEKREDKKIQKNQKKKQNQRKSVDMMAEMNPRREMPSVRIARIESPKLENPKAPVIKAKSAIAESALNKMAIPKKHDRLKDLDTDEPCSMDLELDSKPKDPMPNKPFMPRASVTEVDQLPSTSSSATSASSSVALMTSTTQAFVRPSVSPAQPSEGLAVQTTVAPSTVTASASSLSSTREQTAEKNTETTSEQPMETETPSTTTRTEQRNDPAQMDTSSGSERDSSLTYKEEKKTDGGVVETLHHHHADGSKTSVQWNKGKTPNIQVGNKNKMVVNQGLSEWDELPKQQRRPKKKHFRVNKDTLIQSLENVKPGHMDLVASRIGRDWKKMAWEMDIPRAKLEQIEMDYKAEGTYELAYQVIKDWVNRIGIVATISNLAFTLHRVDRDDIAVLIKDEFH